MNNRHKRRAEYAQFRRETRGALLTWLLDANDPSLHKAPPLVVRAAHHWCANLPTEPRHCICCLSLIWDQRAVGGLLLSATLNTTSASINAVCNRCWAAQRLDEIENAATEVLRAAVPNGHFEPLSS
jgi:hypothetical protein